MKVELLFLPVWLMLFVNFAITFGQEKVKERPIEAEFMQLVSFCVDEAIWQDNQDFTQVTKDGKRAEESTMGTYILKMQMCLDEGIALHKVKTKKGIPVP